MITLYTFGPGFGLPDPSPFVTKAEVLLKMAQLPYRTDSGGFSRAPKGKLPYIADDGAIIADSTFIRRHIEKKYRIDFDPGLDAAQRATAWAFEKMIEDNLYWTVVHDRWMDDTNFRNGPMRFFDRVPAPLRPFVAALIRRRVRGALHGQGMGRHSDDEILALATRSPTSSATNRSSSAANRPGSTPPCSPSWSRRCVRISPRGSEPPPRGTTTCGATSAA